MTLKLHGLGLSTCTRRVAAVLVEKKIPFELVEVNVQKMEHKQPPHLKNQPFAMIPFIDHDGFILYESRAICQYLEEAFPSHGPKLIPTDLKAKGLYLQAVSIEQNNFDPHASPAVAEIVFKPFWGLTPDKAVFDQHIADLTKKLDVYDQILGKQKYLAGDEMTLADMFHLPYAYTLAAAGSDLMTNEQRPNLVRWWKDISSRPGWVAVKDGDIKSAAQAIAS